MDYSKLQICKFEKCISEEIANIITKLNSNASNGYDGISTKLVKKYKDKFAESLMKHINSSMENGNYPQTLKIAAVVPIYNSGDKKNCNNYRPITKLSVLDKIFEQVILDRLKQHLKANKIINKNQYGFIEDLNTLAACINCTENIYKNADSGKHVALLSIDLQKAFDSTDITALINKLDEINIKGNELELLGKFLRNRAQFTQINDKKKQNKGNKSRGPTGIEVGCDSLYYIHQRHTKIADKKYSAILCR